MLCFIVTALKKVRLNLTPKLVWELVWPIEEVGEKKSFRGSFKWAGRVERMEGDQLTKKEWKGIS